VETARALLGDADARSRTLVADVLSEMTGDTGSQAETTHLTIGAPGSQYSRELLPLAGLEQALPGDQQLRPGLHGAKLSHDLRLAAHKIAERIAAVRSRAARGQTVDSAEVQNILEEAELVRFTSSMWNDLSTLWTLRALADDETSGKWQKVLN